MTAATRDGKSERGLRSQLSPFKQATQPPSLTVPEWPQPVTYCARAPLRTLTHTKQMHTLYARSVRMPTPDADRGVLSSFASLSLGALLKRVTRVTLAPPRAMQIGAAEEMPALVT